MIELSNKEKLFIVEILLLEYKRLDSINEIHLCKSSEKVQELEEQLDEVLFYQGRHGVLLASFLMDEALSHIDGDITDLQQAKQALIDESDELKIQANDDTANLQSASENRSRR